MGKFNVERRRYTSGPILLPAAVFLVAVSGTLAADAPGQQLSRQAKVEKLLAVIRDKELQQRDPKKFRSAIEELGKMRATEAIDDLVELLAYQRDWQRERPASDYINVGSGPTAYRGADFPATTALADIGKPALPALVRTLEHHDETSLISKNARYTVRSIFNRPPFGDADSFFREQASHAPSAEAARRLLKALETANDDWKIN